MLLRMRKGRGFVSVNVRFGSTTDTSSNAALRRPCRFRLQLCPRGLPLPYGGRMVSESPFQPLARLPARHRALARRGATLVNFRAAVAPRSGRG